MLAHLAGALLPHCRGELKPGLKVGHAVEDVGHEEVEQRPQLCQVVLQRGACTHRSGFWALLLSAARGFAREECREQHDAAVNEACLK
eukprot:385443-Pelagomonas_calceolata.AAC.9